VRNEELAARDMLDGTSLQQEFFALWEEYEARESIESKIVKDADNLDVDFELAEQATQGSTLKEVKRETRQFVSENKLYTKTAKAMFDQLQSANPHDWHFKGRNRSNGGDWQK
jgi:5'-deoxynucleotidase YfbR-like HD superfamily hydrolase